MREVRWERMFPDELEAAYAQCPVAYFAYGLCEPHGPQNAIGLDAIKAHHIACLAAREHGGIVAPPDFWHIHELGGYGLWGEACIGEARPWLTAMPPWMHFKNVCYHIRQADVLGFRAAIFLTGHYGPNWKDLKTMLELVQPHVGTRLYGLPDFEANDRGFDEDGKSGGDHAGKVETSLLWALEPESVDVSRMPEKGDTGKNLAMGGNAYDSDRRIGERMVADEVRWLGNEAGELLSAYDAERPEHKLRTFEQVERLWDGVVRPKLADFESMQEKWGEQPDVQKSSRWHENWHVPDRG